MLYSLHRKGKGEVWCVCVVRARCVVLCVSCGLRDGGSGGPGVSHLDHVSLPNKLAVMQEQIVVV